MSKISFTDILELSVSERLQLAQDIWDSIASDPHAVPLTDAQRAELERRLENYAQDPEAGATWAEVRRRLQSGS